MPIYVVESRDIAGKYLATLPFRDLQFETLLNSSGGARLTMPLSHVDFTSSELEEGRTELYIYRNSSLVYVGPVWNISVSKNDNTLKVDSEGLASYFDVREIETKTTYNTTYGEMAWNLINGTQNLSYGSLGITRGNQTPGNAPSGQETFAAGEKLSESLSKLADPITGFDWYITPQRVYNQFYPRISTSANDALYFPGNIITYGVTRNGKYCRNKIRTVGAEGYLTPFGVDQTSLAKFGVRHFTDSQTDMTSKSLLAANTGHVLALRKDPKLVVSISVHSEFVNPFDGDINLGQTVKVSVTDTFTNINQLLRCVGWQTSAGKQGKESINLYFNDDREVE